jgi:hypothetical protein
VDRNAFFFCLLQRAAKSVFFHLPDIRKAQFPFSILFYGAHERVGNAHRDIEIRNVIFVRLGSDKVFHIGVIDAQDRHIRATPCSALRNLIKGMIVHA